MLILTLFVGLYMATKSLILWNTHHIKRLNNSIKFYKRNKYKDPYLFENIVAFSVAITVMCLFLIIIIAIVESILSI